MSATRPGPHFTLFGFPVRISPFFFVIIVVLGLPRGEEWTSEVIGKMALWGVVVFVSILWHELGHAFAMRRFGFAPAIVLHGLGGHTEAGRGPRTSAVQRIAISLAGPMAGFVLGALTFPLYHFFGRDGAHWALQEGLMLMLWINIGWGLVNLVPMLPWDGGHVLEGVLDLLTGDKGRKPAAVVTVVLSVLIAAGLFYAFREAALWPIFLCGLSLMQGVRALRMPPPRVGPANAAEAVPGLRAAEAALSRVGPPEHLVGAILSGASSEEWSRLGAQLERVILPVLESPADRAMARELAAWAYLLAGDAALAGETAAAMRPTHDPSPILSALIALKTARFADALRVTADMDRDDDTAARVLIEAYAMAATGRIEDAAEAFGGDRRAGSLVDSALFAAGSFDNAAHLGAALFERFGNAEDAYNTACSHARAGRPLEGLDWLERAVDAGYDDLRHLESDDDLASVRALDGFETLRTRLTA